MQQAGAVTSADTAPAAGRGSTAVVSSGAVCAAASVSKPIKIPKLPMVQYGKKWYRAKVLKDGGSRVMLEYQGYSHEGGPFWLAKDHPRIWRGSYKGRDWRYLVSHKHGVQAVRSQGQGLAVLSITHGVCGLCTEKGSKWRSYLMSRTTGVSKAVMQT